MSSTGSYSSGGMPKNPTFSTLKISAGGTFDLYNTADQTTNYERLRAYWSGNTALLSMEFGGSASTREIRIGSASTAGAVPVHYFRANAATSPALGLVGGNWGGGIFASVTGVYNADSVTQTAFAITPTINQFGTAGYIALDINPTESATGSGTKLLQRWAVGGTVVGVVSKGGVFSVNDLGVSSAGSFGFLSSTSIGSAGFDVTLSRDAADTLALRRSTNAQIFRVYNTYTDASNYERGVFGWTSGTLLIGTEQAGTGASRDMAFRTAGANRWVINTAGHFLANLDNTYDIGASGANRPRNIYVGSGIVAGGIISTTNYVSSLYSVITDGATPPGATVGQAKIYVDSGDGDLKIVFGDGTVKTIVTDT